MVQQQFKESTIVIIDTGKRVIKAGRGLHDLLPAPTVSLQARVGLRKADATRFRNGTGAMEVEDPSASSPLPLPKGLRPSNYLVGHLLDEAIAAGEDVELWWPFDNGSVKDWTQAEALWKYVLFQGLHLRRTLNEFPVLLSLPKPLSFPAYQTLAQVFFERFNVAAFSVFDRAVVQIFAANQTSGIVVEVDDYETDISCVVDGFVVPSGSLSIPLGLSDCIRHLTNVLSTSSAVMPTLSPPTNPIPPDQLLPTLQRLAEHLYNEGHISPPATLADAAAAAAAEDDDGTTNIASILVAGKERTLIDASSKRKSAARSAAERAAEKEKEKERIARDLVEIEFEGRKVTVGKERHRMCEPLLDSDLVKSYVRDGLKDELTCMTLPAGINAASRELDLPIRAVVWEAIQVAGKLGRAKTFGAALTSHLRAYVARDPAEFGMGITTDQPKSFRVVKVPEYFAHYREIGDELAGFLGASIVAKLTFNDPSGKFLSKTDYSSKGPSAMAELF